MAIGKLKSRTDFTEYCMRKLGAPVIEINIDDDQVEDCVDDALDHFWEYHADGTTQMFYKHLITQEDIDNGYFKTPYDVLNVIRILSLTGGGTGIANYDNLQYVSYFSDLISQIPKAGISSYVITSSYLNLIDDTFSSEKRISFNKHQDKVYILGDQTRLQVGQYLVYEAVTINDPKTNPETWNNAWLKLYTVALMKKQWGINITKYTGVTLPAGVVLRGEGILNEATEEIQKLEDRLRDEFQLPPDMFWG